MPTATRHQWLQLADLIRSSIPRRDPHTYLSDVLERLPSQLNSRLEELLPHRRQPA